MARDKSLLHASPVCFSVEDNGISPRAAVRLRGAGQVQNTVSAARKESGQVGAATLNLFFFLTDQIGQ